MTDLAALLNITRITAKKRVDNLKNRDIIRNPIALYDPFALDLHRINVYAHVNSIQNLEILEKACDEHPYTHYRGRAFGGGFGLFMQYDIPPKTELYMSEFLDGLIQADIIDSYQLSSSTDHRIETYADLQRYNAKLSSWNFSWSDWFAALKKKKSALPEKPKESIDYQKFHPSHFKILRLLTADASIKQADIITKMKLSRTQAHREYNYVLDNYIDEIRFIYNREVFDLTETYIAFGFDISIELITSIYDEIKANPPPFRLVYDILENNQIFLWSNMSPAQASSFAFSIWTLLNNVQIYTLDTKKSEMYWFYPDNFDFNTYQWKTSKDYMVNEPLERTLS